jgi:hypothetical protein
MGGNRNADSTKKADIHIDGKVKGQPTTFSACLFLNTRSVLPMVRKMWVVELACVQFHWETLRTNRQRHTLAAEHREGHI